jgi:hypothetical protein
VELQAGIIKRWRDEGIHDAWVALDACDAADLARSASPGEASVGPTMNLVAVARATLYWMVAAGLEDVRAAAMHLRLVVRDIRALYDPHQRASGEKAISAPFRYSNDPAASRPQIFS